MKNITIKSKAYLLVSIGIMATILLSVVSVMGLNTIENKLKSLELVTNVERNAYKTMIQEKNYLLNTNIATSNSNAAKRAFVSAQKNIQNIYTTLDMIENANKTMTDSVILQKAKIARENTKKYELLYKKGVSVIKNLQKSCKRVEIPQHCKHSDM